MAASHIVRLTREWHQDPCLYDQDPGTEAVEDPPIGSPNAHPEGRAGGELEVQPRIAGGSDSIRAGNAAADPNRDGQAVTAVDLQDRPSAQGPPRGASAACRIHGPLSAGHTVAARKPARHRSSEPPSRSAPAVGGKGPDQLRRATSFEADPEHR